jgi:Dehydroquinase class II
MPWTSTVALWRCHYQCGHRRPASWKRAGADSGIPREWPGQSIEGTAVKAGEPIGAVFNPGAFTHTSAALHDAIEGVSPPLIECHISNVHKREAFRHHSFISPVAMNDSDPLVTATRNVGIRKVCRSMSGSGARSRCRVAAASRPAAGSPTATTVAHEGTARERRLAAYVRPPRPRQVSRTRAQSSRGSRSSGSDGTSRIAIAKAITPSGRLIRNSQCQLA